MRQDWQFRIRVVLTMIVLGFCIFPINACILDYLKYSKRTEVLYHPKIDPGHMQVVLTDTVPKGFKYYRNGPSDDPIDFDDHNWDTQIDNLDEFFDREYESVEIRIISRPIQIVPCVNFNLDMFLYGVTKNGSRNFKWLSTSYGSRGGIDNKPRYLNLGDFESSFDIVPVSLTNKGDLQFSFVNLNKDKISFLNVITVFILFSCLAGLLVTQLIWARIVRR